MSADAHRSDTAGAKRLHVVQGEYAVSGDPDVMMGTILGSCVAACVRDPVAGVGGMNHFLLPGDKDSAGAGGGPQGQRYGVQSMELLLNALYRAHVLGGKRASGADAPLFKSLLFLLLERQLRAERLGARQRAELEAWQKILVAAVRQEASE